MKDRSSLYIYFFIKNNPELSRKMEKLLGGEKFKKWFFEKNPNLGDARPVELIARGKIMKLVKFIENALSENELVDK